MSDSALEEAHKAKIEYQRLKDQLKSNDAVPWGRPVETQRTELRRCYVRLLLAYPYAPECKDCENYLWMQTSHNFIALYKQRIGPLSRSAQGPTTSNDVEYRKLIDRFRQFLADEEKFWSALIVRLCRAFQLTEATGALVSLKIIPSPASLLPPSQSEQADTKPSRNEQRLQSLFPQEGIQTPLPSAQQRPAILAILSKALTCLGDIARYREQYNERGGRTRIGHDDNIPATRGRRRRGGNSFADIIPKPRDYDKAKRCYETARLILPTDGNPIHQLAILASYKKEPFNSIVFYYRALCLHQPFDTAWENMSNALSKALEAYRSKMQANNEPEDQPATSDEVPPRIRVERIREQVVVLHALWHIGGENSDSQARELDNQVCRDLQDLVTNRILPENLISDLPVLAQGALWKNRMMRGTTSPTFEFLIFPHLLGIHRALLEVGLGQLKDTLQEPDLGQRISAVFRRTLPALRIGSKWLRANLDYVMRGPHAANKLQLREFWDTYSRFLRALTKSFPLSRLPTYEGPLEEDVDMCGFLPLKGLMDFERRAGVDVETFTAQSKDHPNVHQLMRISDLIVDAKELTKAEGSPLTLYGNQFVLLGAEASQPPAFMDPRSPVDQLSSRDSAHRVMADDDNDDPVSDAWNFVRQHQEEDEEDDQREEIVWDPRRSLGTSTALQPDSPKHRTTARDLLDNLRLGATSNHHGPLSSGPALGPSIWSPSNEQHRVAYPATTSPSLHRHTASVPRPNVPLRAPHSGLTPLEATSYQPNANQGYPTVYSGNLSYSHPHPPQQGFTSHHAPHMSLDGNLPRSTQHSIPPPVSAGLPPPFSDRYNGGQYPGSWNQVR